MYSNESIQRIEKKEKIKNLGIAVNPAKYDKIDKIGDLNSKEDNEFRVIEEIIPNPTKEISTAGRVVLYRSFGKISFATIQDDSGRIQIMFSRENCNININGEIKSMISEELSAYKFIEKLVDLGDFIGIKGELFKTHKGELTVFVSEFSFLGKSIRPLPEKFHGIADEEIMYRQRYLDLIMNEETMNRFRFRSDFIRKLREFYWKEGFTEIEGQVLTNAATGAAAKPYVTHQNALDIDVFLRISHEIPLKVLNTAGFEKVFELGKAFRNEGQDPSHLPEHTHLEHNCSYWTYEDNIEFTEKMFNYLFDELKLERKRQILNKAGELVDVDFTTPWQRIDYIELVKKDTGIDVSKYENVEDLRKDIKAQNIQIEGIDKMGLTTLIDYLYKKMSRPKLINPTFLYNYPIKLKPFARRNDENPLTVDAFQLLINGWELVNSYSELVDSFDQAERFKEGEKALADGDEEAMTGDDEFIYTMEHGMPPISGWGMGVDRIISLLTQQNNLRDIVLFPLMKPEIGEVKTEGKSKETKVAVAIINKGAKMEKWQELNTIAHLSSAFAARLGKNLLLQDTIETSDNQQIKLNIQHAIIIKQSNDQKKFNEIIKDSKDKGLDISEFTREMIETTDDKKVIAVTKNKNYSEIEYLGLLVFGNKKEVDEVTKGFELLN